MSKRIPRREKVLSVEGKPQTKEKFLANAREEDQQPTLPKFDAANPKQKLVLSMFHENRSMVFLHGSAGTGKSLLAAYRAASLLKQKKIDKVYLVRPAVSVGKSAGLLPGTIEEKLAPYFAQTIAHLRKFLGPYVDYCLRTGVIEMKAVEYLRGTSFENCLVICEEVQNFSEEEFEMMLTRLGENASYIFTGDTRQHDLRGQSGLAVTIDKISRTLDSQPEEMSDQDLELMNDLIGIVEFTPEDVVRSGLTKAIVKMYYHQ